MQVKIKPILYGVIASVMLLGVYFAVLTLISGWSYALGQFSQYWYFIASLAVGFGIQIGLYSYFKSIVSARHGMGKVVGVTGTTSTVAMLSCCAHYLVNILPIIGVAGIVTFIAAYQIELFWVGIIFNLTGIAYIGSRIYRFKKQNEA